MNTLVKGPRGGRLIRSYRTNAEIERDFWARVSIKSEHECWEWTGGTNNGRRSGVGSYGIVWFNGVRFRAHRMAFESKIRKLKPGELVCHSCDNPPCCNPGHLFAGTNLENTRDCLAKCRARRERGEDRYNARLTSGKIFEIRSRYIPRKFGIDALAAIYGVSRSMIFAIVKGRRWRHLLAPEKESSI